MKVRGKILNVELDYVNLKPKITFQLEKQIDLMTEEFNQLREVDLVDINLEKYDKLKTPQANAYCWVLMDKIARKIRSTKEEVYRKCIVEKGIFKVITMNKQAVSTFERVWNDRGLGWICEIYDSNIENMKDVYAYYGISSYNRKQMSEFLDYVVDEAQNLGIQTETPNEIRKMISLIKE